MSIAGKWEEAMRGALAAEPDWQALLRHFDFNEGFAFVLILVESVENAALCRETLGDYLKEQGKGSIRLITPSSPSEVRELPYKLHKPSVPDSVQALWIESVVPEGSVPRESFEEWRSAWRGCFASLNQIRNTIQRTIPCALVFAASPWMQELIRNIAPDLWSIRSTVARISPRIPSGEAETPPEPFLRRGESDPLLAPDPEFAEREASNLRGKLGQELGLVRVLQRAAEGYLARNDVAKGLEVLKEAQELQLSASESPVGLAQTLTLLGRAYQMGDEWSRAEEYFREAVELDRSALGEEHPAVATSMNDLASLLVETNRLEEAESLYRRTLANEEKSYGSDHPRVAASLNDLALVLKRTNRIEEAEPLYRRALAIDEKIYGLDHPEVARALNNLGVLLRETDRLEEAEVLFRRALAIIENNHELGRTRMSTCLNNLAAVLQVTNRVEEAEKLCRRALSIDEDIYGPNHPDVARDLNNLAGLLQATNRPAKAEPIYRRAQAILEGFAAKSGYPHPGFETVASNYRRLLDSLGHDHPHEPNVTS